MTNILVPTDFTVSSVKMAEGVFANANFEKCNLILFHAFEMPSSPFDLWGGYKDPSCELATESFRLACKQIKDDNPSRVCKINLRCMLGSTRVLFRNWAEANDIDLIYCPNNYIFKPAHSRSVDPLYLFAKCNIPVIRTQATSEEFLPEPSYFRVIPIPTR